MTDQTDLAARVDALEIHIAYQEEFVQDLSAMVTRQWEQIDRLSRQVKDLVDQVKEAELKAGHTGAPEPPPPHY